MILCWTSPFKNRTTIVPCSLRHFVCVLVNTLPSTFTAELRDSVPTPRIAFT
jgi:hypothetical protein